MEAKALFGGSPCLSSSLPRLSAQRTCSLFYTHKHILRTFHHDLHLAALHSKSHLFSYSTSRPHSRTLSHKTRIFLPHLVASMVCFLPYLFFTLASNYRNSIELFSHFLQYLQSLLEPHLKIFTSFCACHFVCRNKLKRLI
jgi:hypothetical protein